MKRLSVVLLSVTILICCLLLIYDRKSEQGILNELGQKGKKVENRNNTNNSNTQVHISRKGMEEQRIIANSEETEQTSIEPPFTVVLDPGHQEKGNAEQEPIGPGSAETKAKVTGGTTGVVTNKPEYELTLEIALLLQDILEEKGFEVALTRTTNQVDISNRERAEVANDLKADLFLRIHADGAESAEANGFSLLVPGAESHYTEAIHGDSLLAAETILDNIEEQIDLHQNGIIFRNDLSGFNWSEVPVILVELGFMTNPEEDEKLSDEQYKVDLTNMIANGIEAYEKEKK